MTDQRAFRSERGPLLVAMMTTNVLVAINATVLAVTVPAVVADLGGLTLFPWLFSLYMLAQAASIPVYAKLADLYGRKPLILFGMGLFAVASVLCGFAWDMPSLIVLRTLQGLGAGAVHPIAVTIIGDLYTVRERAKVLGYLASAWGIGSVAGPILGGLLAGAGAWRASFFLYSASGHGGGMVDHPEVPGDGDPGRAAHGLRGCGNSDDRPHTSRARRAFGRHQLAVASIQSVACFVCGAALLLIFGFIETRAFDPVVPLRLLTQRLLAAAAFISIGAGAIITGVSTYIPIYMVGTLGLSPLYAGLVLCAFMAGWPLSTAVSVRIYLRIGFRATAAIGGSIMIVGTATLVAFARTPAVPTVLIACFVIGLGMGLSASPALISAQASVEWRFRGVVSGTIMFCRLLGSALGIAIFGALGNGVLRDAGDSPDAADFGDVGFMVFLGLGAAAALCFVGALAMPPHRPPPKEAPAVVDDSSIA